MSHTARLLRYAVILLAGGMAVSLAQDPPVPAPGPSGAPARIDGSRTPDQIPDRHAYPILFHRLAGPDSDETRAVFLRDSRLPESDAALVFRAAERFEQLSSEGMSQLAEARRKAPRPPPPALMDAYRAWNERIASEMESVLRAFQRELTPAGQALLRDYVLNHIKRNMSVHLGGAANAAAPPPAPPDTALDAKALAAIEEAAKALVVLRVEERESEAIIELWNGSPKQVAAFQVAICAPALFSKSGLDTFGQSNPGIATGATYRLHYSKRNSPRCDVMTPKTVAVIFEDGAAAGLPGELEALKLRRIGQMAETWRIHAILAAAGGAVPPDWAALRRQVGEMPDGDQAALESVIASAPPGVEARELNALGRAGRFALFGAVAHVRATALRVIEQLASTPAGLQLDEWIRTRARYREQTELFQAFCRNSAGSLFR